MLVVNFNKYGSKESLTEKFGAKWIYIGRANKRAGFEKSPLANPYRRKPGMAQGETLEMYRKWLWELIKDENEEVIDALRRIDENSVLVCWCKPGPCHGDVVIAAAKWLREQEK